MNESIKTKLYRYGLNLFPVFRRTGGRATFISANWQIIKARLPLNIFTKNIVGTIFGGSMYAFCDPIYMLMLMKILGKEYIVWDKSASIKFVKPGTETLYAEFIITDSQIEEIKKELMETFSITYNFQLELKSSNGTVYAEINKELYLRRKDAKDRFKK